MDLGAEEKRTNARPQLRRQVSNLNNYDVIFIGYPNWNADLPMPLYTFLENNNFSGKTIVPFSTHGGSGFSNTIRTIARLQPNATVITDGFTVSRDRTGNAENDVRNWVRRLNLGQRTQ
jgi:flavodoxin